MAAAHYLCRKIRKLPPGYNPKPFVLMAYDKNLADAVREYLVDNVDKKIEEKRMFGGLAFMVDGKMCVNVSGDQLMCRFDPALTEEIAEWPGFSSMIMKGKVYQGYCYVAPEGFRNKQDFDFWMTLCLDFNDSAKSSKKVRRK